MCGTWPFNTSFNSSSMVSARTNGFTELSKAFAYELDRKSGLALRLVTYKDCRVTTYYADQTSIAKIGLGNICYTTLPREEKGLFSFLTSRNDPNSLKCVPVNKKFFATDESKSGIDLNKTYIQLPRTKTNIGSVKADLSYGTREDGSFSLYFDKNDFKKCNFDAKDMYYEEIDADAVLESLKTRPIEITGLYDWNSVDSSIDHMGIITRIYKSEQPITINFETWSNSMKGVDLKEAISAAKEVFDCVHENFPKTDANLDSGNGNPQQNPQNDNPSQKPENGDEPNYQEPKKPEMGKAGNQNHAWEHEIRVVPENVPLAYRVIIVPVDPYGYLRLTSDLSEQNAIFSKHLLECFEAMDASFRSAVFGMVKKLLTDKKSIYENLSKKIQSKKFKTLLDINIYLISQSFKTDILMHTCSLPNSDQRSTLLLQLFQLLSNLTKEALTRIKFLFGYDESYDSLERILNSIIS